MSYTINQLKSENGIVSILVSMIMMIVITLVVLGFSELSRNEETNSLNRQLSAAAYYAAESAINSTVASVEQNYPNVPSQPTCGGTTSTYPTQTLSGMNGNVKVTCLSVNPTPSSIQQTAPQGDAFVYTLNTGNNQYNYIKFSWSTVGSTAANGACPPNAGEFTSYTSYLSTCNGAPLQLDFIPTADTDSLAGEETGADTVFLSPTNSDTANSNAISDGAVYPADCRSNDVCTVSIPIGNLINSSYIRVIPLYADSNVTITASNGYGLAAPDLPLYGASVVIDATANASGVEQRLVARVPVSQSGEAAGLTEAPEFAIQSGDEVCKRLIIVTVPPDEATPPSASGTFVEVYVHDKYYSTTDDNPPFSPLSILTLAPGDPDYACSFD